MMPASAPAIAVHTSTISLPVLHVVVPIFSAHLIQRMADIGPIASQIASVESWLIDSSARWSFWFLAVGPLPVGAASATVRIDVIMACPTVLAGIRFAVVRLGVADVAVVPSCCAAVAPVLAKIHRRYRRWRTTRLGTRAIRCSLRVDSEDEDQCQRNSLLASHCFG